MQLHSCALQGIASNDRGCQHQLPNKQPGSNLQPDQVQIAVSIPACICGLLVQVHYLSGPIRVVDADGVPARPGEGTGLVTVRCICAGTC